MSQTTVLQVHRLASLADGAVPPQAKRMRLSLKAAQPLPLRLSLARKFATKDGMSVCEVAMSSRSSRAKRILKFSHSANFLCELRVRKELEILGSVHSSGNLLAAEMVHSFRLDGDLHETPALLMPVAVDMIEYLSRIQPAWNPAEGTLIDEELSFQIFLALARAVSYMHGHRVVHRDIKTENVMIVRSSGRPLVADELQNGFVDHLKRGTYRVVLADFDLGALTDGLRTISERCGTKGFSPPELIRDPIDPSMLKFVRVDKVTPLHVQAHFGAPLTFWRADGTAAERMALHAPCGRRVEVLRKPVFQPYKGRPVDIWMLASTLYHMMTCFNVIGAEVDRLSAFQDSCQARTPSPVRLDELLHKFRPRTRKSEMLKATMLLMLMVEPSRRITAEDVVCNAERFVA